MEDPGETSDTSEGANDAGSVSNDIANDEESQPIVMASHSIACPEKESEEIECGVNSKALENEAKLFVHASWLAVHSSYFRSLFYCGMKESRTKEVVMKVYQSELQAHLLLIEAMYKPDVLDDKECRLVVQVLVLANKYDVNIVFKKCKYVLISTSISLPDCEYILEYVSHIPDCVDIRKAMETFLVKEFNPLDNVWQSKKFRKLSKKSLKLLLRSDKLMVQSENTVFTALMHWVKLHIEEMSRKSAILSLVRFEFMTVDFLYDVVRHHPTAKDMNGFHELLQNGFAYHALPPSRVILFEINPVPRSSCNNKEPTFSWIIDQALQKHLIEDGEITSDFFWCKGYMLDLTLRYRLPTGKYSLIMRTRNDVYVKISWSAKTDLFGSVDCPLSYRKPLKGFGYKNLESVVIPNAGPDTPTHKIDVWVTIT